MKLLKLFTVLCLLAICESGVKKDFKKFTRTKCSASGKTCLNLFCYIKLVSRYSTLLSFGCENFTRPVDNFLFNAANWKINMQGNHRQIINLKNLDACSIMGKIHLFPMFRQQVDFLNQTFAGMIHDCPYKGLKIINSTLHVELNGSEMPAVDWANGNYKTTFKVADELDDNIITLHFWSEEFVHFRGTIF